MNFYSYEKKTDRIYIFTEGYSSDHRFTIGAVVGDDRILVIDAGLGCDGRGLRDYIESVLGVEKPMICACTHGHIDHIGSAKVFDKAYLNEGDYGQLKSACSMERRKNDLAFFSMQCPQVIAYCESRMLENSDIAFENIVDGDVLELGGITVKAICLAGHSKGSMAYYCEAEDVAFVGDGISSCVALGRLSETEILAYGDTVERFIGQVRETTNLYSGHVSIPQSITAAKNIATAAREIGMGIGSKEDAFTGIGILPKDIPPEVVQVRNHFVGNNCIQYNSAFFKEHRK